MTCTAANNTDAMVRTLKAGARKTSIGAEKVNKARVMKVPRTAAAMMAAGKARASKISLAIGNGTRPAKARMAR